MKESDIQKKILDYLRKNKLGYYAKFHNGPYGARGVSDIVGTHRGIAVFIEVKSEKGRLTKLQEKFLREVREEGAVAGVARSVEDAKGLISQARLMAAVLNRE